MHVLGRLRLLLLVVLCLGLTQTLRALAALPHFSVTTADGQLLTDAHVSGRRVLLWYEGPDTVELNNAAKAELTQTVAALPVAQKPFMLAAGDLSGFDYWPARSFAKRKLRHYEAFFGHPIYADWTGAMRAAFGLPKDVSNLLLIAADGTIVFQGSGKISDRELQRVITVLRGAP
jgi:hypothetical protein